jgi:hypothetical protein
VLPFRIELAGLTEESSIRSVATRTLNFILKDYFFLYPAGHFGLTAVTFLVSLPLMHVIVFFTCATGGFTGELTAGGATTLGGAGLVVTKVTADFAQTSVVSRDFFVHRVIG